MPTNINQLNEKLETAHNRAKDIVKLTALRTSKIPDIKNAFKHEEKEKAFELRYGKKVKITVTYEMDGPLIKEYTLRFQSEKNNHYVITEYLKNDITDYVLFGYNNNGRVIENKYNRFVDAEIALSDILAEEQNGNS